MKPKDDAIRAYQIPVHEQSPDCQISIDKSAYRKRKRGGIYALSYRFPETPLHGPIRGRSGASRPGEPEPWTERQSGCETCANWVQNVRKKGSIRA
jgi:hypothetical protein